MRHKEHKGPVGLGGERDGEAKRDTVGGSSDDRDRGYRVRSGPLQRAEHRGQGCMRGGGARPDLVQGDAPNPAVVPRPCEPATAAHEDSGRARSGARGSPKSTTPAGGVNHRQRVKGGPFSTLAHDARPERIGAPMESADPETIWASRGGNRWQVDDRPAEGASPSGSTNRNERDRR